MAQKYSFRQFLTEPVKLISNDGTDLEIKIDKISIPMIQRDYAQGRKLRTGKKDSAKLNPAGKKFINEIFAVLSSDSEDGRLELDFIYGSITREKGAGSAAKYVFSPLDGQQRLTTLFLLYWFIGGAELPPEKRGKLSEILRNFVYLTRRSSTDFCQQLVNELNRNNLNYLPVTEAVLNDGVGIESADDIVAQIKDLHWFHDAYKLDPTIVSMLNMLGEIQALYLERGCKNVFGKLERFKFYVLPLSNFNLTEDLYVKMNARGKQLTEFENFKADLQDWMKKHARELNLGKQRYAGRDLPYDIFFIGKIDNEWSQIFWNIVKDSENKNFDPHFLSFFYKYLLNEYVLRYRGNNRDIDKQEDFAGLSQKGGYTGFSLFEKCLTKETVENLVVLLNKLCGYFDEITEGCQPVWFKYGERFDFLTRDLELKDRAVFCAAVLYLVKKDFDRQAFSQWMRVVWNIAENSDIDSWAVAAGVMQTFFKLSNYSDDIYKALADDTLTAGLQSVAVAEERQKAGLILRDPAWLPLFRRAEAHPFFKGSVSFLIPDDESVKGFEHNIETAEAIFDSNGIAPKYRDDGHIFLRALISRYQALSDIKYHIADTDEKEHGLKKMLSSDNVVRLAVREWFSLPEESDIMAKLKEEVAKDSPIPVIDNDFDKKLHEALYKRTDLINWMQENNATRYKDNYISRPNSFYDWIFVWGYRNEIICELLNRGWQCKNRCRIGQGNNPADIPYFWSSSWREIAVDKTEDINGITVNLICMLGSDSITLQAGDSSFAYPDYNKEVTDESKVVPFVDKILLPVEQMKNPRT